MNNLEIRLLEHGRYIITCNCYGLLTEKAAVIIDPGTYTEELKKFFDDNKDKERLILLTHGHYDHIGGAEKLREETGVKIAIGKTEEDATHDSYYNLSERFRQPIHEFYCDILLCDRQTLTVGDLEIEVILTAGHSKGSVSYLADGVLFSGDTLFYETVGRTDLAGSSQDEIIKSVKKLMLLPESTVVYPGHGNKTSIGHEKAYNPFLR